LQYLRAVAAVCVLLYHLGFYINHYTHDPSVLAVFEDTLGRFGVLVFFGLSGYLMAIQARRMQAEPSRFLLHRVVRIYPTFWLVCLLQAMMSFALADPRPLDPLTLLLAPLGSQRAYALGIEWTLIYEIGFYLTVWLLVALRLGRHVTLAAACWLLVILGMTLLRGERSVQLPDDAGDLLLSFHTVAFATGLLLQALPRRLWTWLLLLAGVAVGWHFGLLAGRLEATAYAVSCACLVAVVARLPEHDPVPLRWLARLGDWSFALYLVHVPVLMIVLPQLAGYSLPLLVVTGLAAALAAGGLIGAADIALHARLRRICDSMRPGRSAVACGLFLAAFAGTILAARLQDRADRRLPPTLQSLQHVSRVEEVPGLLLRAGYKEEPALTGSLDVFRRGPTGLFAAGWSSDPGDVLNRSRLMLVVPGQGVTLLAPRNYRMDLLTFLGVAHSAAPVGFERTLRDEACPSGRPMLLVFVSFSRKVMRVVGPTTCSAMQPPATPS
jgi:peptidoglycan/LPS O-acetylase OafA/YrhL